MVRGKNFVCKCCVLSNQKIWRGGDKELKSLGICMYCFLIYYRDLQWKLQKMDYRCDGYKNDVLSVSGIYIKILV